MVTDSVQLVWPGIEFLPGYVAALKRGWSPDNNRPEAAREELAHIARNPGDFLGSLVDREAKGPPITLPDGSRIPRLPGYRRWVWDGEFCGSIGFRWQPGTSSLPVYVPGHIGYAIVPWKQGRGYAKFALRSLLMEVRQEGLTHVDITTDEANVASQYVIAANGGELVERFAKPAQHGEAAGLRYRIRIAVPKP